jgi:tetratricopeptide (TPR) repeat protein
MRIEGDPQSATRDIAEAQAIFAESGEQLDNAHLDLYRAELLLDQNEPSKADQVATQALEVFTKARSAYEEVIAHVVLSESLFKENRLPEARQHNETAIAMAKKSTFRVLELAAEIINAQIQASSPNQSDRDQALKSLRSLVPEAHNAGFPSAESEARLALAETELSYGEKSSAVAELSRLQKDAAARGWQLTERKAAADLKRAQS